MNNPPNGVPINVAGAIKAYVPPIRAPTLSIGDIVAMQDCRRSLTKGIEIELTGRLTGNREKKGPEMKPYSAENAIRFGSSKDVYQSAKMRMVQPNVDAHMMLNLKKYINRGFARR